MMAGASGGAASPLFRHPWRFVLAAPNLGALPPEGPPEIAFAGRSNVGKSSLINALVGRTGLARTSNTPGRTQALNFFVPDPAGSADAVPPIALVDMPGYGYAKAPKSEVAQWTRLIHDYLRGRASLKRIFILVDSRHGLKASDTTIMNELDRAAVSYQLVLTKTDKIRPAALAIVEAETAATIRKHAAAFPEILATSSETGAGIEALREVVATFASP